MSSVNDADFSAYIRLFGEMLEMAHWYEITPFLIAYSIAIFVLRNWRIKSCAILAISGAVSFIYYRFYQLDNDICIETGMVVSDEIKLNAGVAAIMKHYEEISKKKEYSVQGFERVVNQNLNLDYWQSNFTNWKIIDAERFIPYASKEEFLAVNPKCCRLTTYLNLEEGISRYERIRWRYSRYVDGLYSIRYIDKSGRNREVTEHWSSPVDHCGRALSISASPYFSLSN